MQFQVLTFKNLTLVEEISNRSVSYTYFNDGVFGFASGNLCSLITRCKNR